MQKIILSLVILLATFITPPVKAMDDAKPVKDGVARYVNVRLVPEYSHVTAGQSMRFVLEQKITDHWHTYWINPGDSGEATRIKWNLPNGFTGGDLSFPAPERIPFGPLLNFGYNKQALFMTDITAPAIIDGDEVTLKANVEWLVCKDICVPEMAEASVTLPVARDTIKPAKTDEALFIAADNAQPKEINLSGNFEEGDGTITLNFKGESIESAQITSAEFFPFEWGIILNPNAQEFQKTNDGFSLRMSRDTRPLSELKSLDGVLVLIDANGNRVGHKVSIALPTIAASPPVVTGDNQNGSTSLTLLSAVFFALLGGIVLNLMPCVFPILSMKALSLVKLSDKEQRHAVSSGLAYTAGVLLCFLSIAGVLIGLQHAGQNIGWGFQLQNPIVVLLLSYLLFLIGLNLSGYFEISGSFVTAGQSLTTKHGLTGSFFTGVLATLVATPCTAPFMGAALGFALTQPPAIALLVFLSLGLGLALPYLLLCVSPHLRSLMPKPGTWMVTFKEFLAFPIYASAAWLFWVYAQQISNMSLLFTGLIGAVLIVMSLWLFKKSNAKLFIKLLAFVTLLCGLMLPFAPLTSQTELTEGDKISESNSAPSHDKTAHGETAMPFTVKDFDAALGGNQAIFVNMTASWCITCKINERVALLDDKTQTLFKDQNIIYMVGDWTNQNPEITDYLKQFDRNGVPLYVYYAPRDPASGTRPEPKILPQLLTPSLIKDTLIPDTIAATK